MAMFENFPYTDMHNLNLDWIIKIAKDFLDQYTHIQQLIADGETSIQNLTDDGLEQLQNKADNLEGLLNEWYNTHSEDIANQLADALSDLNDWYTTHQSYLNQYLSDSIAAFNAAAEAKAAETIETIPDDYTELANKVTKNKNGIEHLNNATFDKIYPLDYFLNRVTNTGLIVESDNRVAFDRIWVKAGSSISVDSDNYKFNLAMYSADSAASMIEYVSMITGNHPYIIPQDCYIASCIGRVDDETLSDTSIAEHYILNLFQDVKIDKLNENIYMMVNPPFAYGTVTSTGVIIDSDKRAFFGRVHVKAGSSVSVDSDDYRFNLALFEQDSRPSIFKYYSFVTGDHPIYIDRDCWISATIAHAVDEVISDLSITDHFKLNLIANYNFNRDNKYYLKDNDIQPISEAKAIFEYSDSAFDTLNENSIPADVYSFIDNAIAANNTKDAAINPDYVYCKKTSSGYDESGIYNLIHYTLSAPKAFNVGVNSIDDKIKNKPKIIIIAGQHGDEKASPIACAHLIDLLTNKYMANPVLEWIHWNMELIIVPIANPWGFANNNYLNYNEINLNRNWNFDWNNPDQHYGPSTTPFSEKETKWMANIIESNKDACMVIDFHTNNSTKTTPEWILTNWIPFIVGYPDIVELTDLQPVIVALHGYKISRQFNEEYNLDLAPSKKLYYCTTGGASRMLKGYVNAYVKIPSLTLECAARLPDEAEGTYYSERMNKINTELIANWIYNTMLIYSEHKQN